MHHCLQIAEMVHTICFYADPAREMDVSARLHWRNRPKQRDLARLARTCKTFRDPALDILWKSINLMHLIHCLPPDLWSIETIEKQKTLIFSRFIHAGDWDRALTVCSSRVKHFSTSVGLWDVSGYNGQINLALPDHMFPQLRSLHYTESLRLMGRFLCPRLTKLSFPGMNRDPQFLLPNIAARCPDLKDFEIWYTYRSPPEPVETEAISLFLQSRGDWESITSSAVDLAAVEHLSRLETLKSFTIRWLPTTASFCRGDHGLRFPALRKLEFARTGTDPVNLEPGIQFLSLCRGLELKSFSACPPYNSTPAQIHPLYIALANSCVHSSLTTLNIDIDEHMDDEPSSDRIPTPVLRTLFCFTNLVFVTIVSTVGFELDDGVISLLAQAWPRLEKLRLVDRGGNQTPQTTLRSLESFAQHCPRLEELELEFDATIILPAPFTHPAQMHLVHLNVGHSPVGTHLGADDFAEEILEDITRFIWDRFPNLEQISSALHCNVENPLVTGQSGRHSTRWYEVEQLWDPVSGQVRRREMSEEL
ncbi:hypothetical protein C8R43DRAFT_935722 [Mycena crocata]|nr:hypothetical protein C8R43DRAFT_935722 [Mycena crocata]